MGNLSDCTDICRDSIVAVSESGRSGRFANPKRETFKKIRVDGCLIENQLAADWVISGTKGDLVLELKGRDVDHATEQVFATLDFWKKRPDSSNTLAGMVICRRYPSVDTKVQRAKDRVRKAFACKLHVTKAEDHDFESLF